MLSDAGAVTEHVTQLALCPSRAFAAGKKEATVTYNLFEVRLKKSLCTCNTQSVSAQSQTSVVQLAFCGAQHLSSPEYDYYRSAGNIVPSRETLLQSEKPQNATTSKVWYYELTVQRHTVKCMQCLGECFCGTKKQ